MTPWLKTSLTFLIGLLLGAAATGLAFHFCFPPSYHPGIADADRILNHLDSKLKFTSDQRGKVDTLLKQELPKADALRQDTDAKFHTLWLDFRSQLRPLLNPEQLEKYNEMVAKWDKHEAEERAGTGAVPVSTEAVTGR
ncbi:MAG TPA: hypothetical protein VJ873_09045 [bacterium]|nr:hypothetical protein [bacterium]